jgi:hypothetical protein
LKGVLADTRRVVGASVVGWRPGAAVVERKVVGRLCWGDVVVIDLDMGVRVVAVAGIGRQVERIVVGA